MAAEEEPVLQLTRAGARRSGHDITPLRDLFHRQRCVRLHRFLEPALLADVLREMERGEFREFAHGDLATELRLQTGTCTGLLHFVINEAAVYRAIEELTGCAPLRSFMGRVYRRFPNGRHHDSWHGDLIPGRQIGMSINLSTEVYDGGLFEIRDVETQRPLGAIANVGFGDAILFHLSPSVEHRVTEVRGSVPKTAFAGWFLNDFDYLGSLTKDPHLVDLA